VTVEEAAPELRHLVGPGDVLHLGGPVQPEAAVVVAEFDDPGSASMIAFGSVGFLTAEAPESMEGIRRARVFAGYAGWGPGQLDAEMEQGSWLTEEALADDVFAPDPEQLWASVVRRKGKDFQLLATMPFDPSTN
jgi:putative transcriptional regulator